MNTDFFLNVFVLSARFLPERSVRLQQQHEGHCPGTCNSFLSVPCILCPALLYVVPNKVQSALWQYGLSSFQAGGSELERFLPKNQHKYPKEIIEF